MDRGAWWATVQGVAQSWTRRRGPMKPTVSVAPLVLVTSEVGKEEQVSGFAGLTM